MACPSNEKDSFPFEGRTGAILDKVDVVIRTYPDLQPFLEMAVLLFEGVYEHAYQVGVSSNKKL